MQQLLIISTADAAKESENKREKVLKIFLRHKIVGEILMMEPPKRQRTLGEISCSNRRFRQQKIVVGITDTMEEFSCLSAHHCGCRMD